MQQNDNRQYNKAIDTEALYIHWPFCPYRCHFCPFVALAGQDEFMEQYHKALVNEIRIFAEKSDKKHRIETIFMGGGTPSTYPNDLLLDMAGILNTKYDILPTKEMTIEVNPGTVKPGQLQVWKQVGINRLSIGVQSLDDRVLHGLNRRQSVSDVYALLNEASKFFDNLSVDLILGLPGVSSEAWIAMIKEIVSWPIKHVSVYFLMVHEHTQLYYKVKSKRISLPVDDEVVDLYDWTKQYLNQHGLLQYELSNFARSGYESKHNSTYWDRKPYKGFGLGAHSFDGSLRFENEKNLTKYLDQMITDSCEPVLYEELTATQIHLEKLMLGLRRIQGVSALDLEGGLSEGQKTKLWGVVTLLEKEGFMIQKQGRWGLTPAGLAVENDILARLSF